MDPGRARPLCILTRPASSPPAFSRDLSPTLATTMNAVLCRRARLTFALSTALDVERGGNVKGALLQLGLCLPAECAAEDIPQLFQLLSGLLQANYNISFGTAGETTFVCPEYEEMTSGAAGVIAMISVFAFAVLLATVYDWYRLWCVDNLYERVPSINAMESQPLLTPIQEKTQGGSLPAPSSRALQALACFSLVQNFPRLVSTRVGSEKHLSALNGIRVLSMAWVILSHTHSWVISLGLKNPSELANLLKRWNIQFIANGFFSVDSFFYLSGFLVGYLALAELQKKGTLPLAKYYIHRFWRLTPTYMFALLVLFKLMPVMSDGPIWYNVADQHSCSEYWWTNLLYINNYYPKDLKSECMGWSWYLALDMQFYIITPIFLFALHRNPKLGVGLISFVIVGCLAATGAITYHWDVTPSPFAEGGGADGDAETLLYFNKIYVQPYARIFPYLVGILTAFFMRRAGAEHGTFAIRIKAPALIVGSLVAFGLMYAPLNAFYPYFHGHSFTMAGKIAYNMFARLSWSIGLAWVTWVCATGNAPVINKLLSLPPFVVLAKITYTAYLLHPIILNIFYYSSRTPFYYSDLTQVYYFLGNIVLAYCSAFVLTLLVEFPFGNLEKLILSRGH
eukprot:Opistho-2@58440